jgi:hypothetical protein
VKFAFRRSPANVEPLLAIFIPSLASSSPSTSTGERRDVDQVGEIVRAGDSVFRSEL